MVEPNLQAQLTFLEKSPVAWAAAKVKSGSHRLMRGLITSNQFLGDQVTIFGNLDGLWAKEEVEFDRFLVRHVYDTLNDARCTDHLSRDRMNLILKALSEHTLVPNITLWAGEPDMVIDGNKTAAAFHHMNLQNEKIELTVFVVAPA